MNDSDVKWLEKLFQQHRDDQQHYLDDKFETINKKLDTRAQDCKNCRACIDNNIASLGGKIDECNNRSTKKVVVGSAVAVAVTLVLYAAFGTDAFSYVIGLIGKMIDVPL